MSDGILGVDHQAPAIARRESGRRAIAVQIAAAVWLLFLLSIGSPLPFVFGVGPLSNDLWVLNLGFALGLSLALLNPMFRDSRWHWLNWAAVGVSLAAIGARLSLETPEFGDTSTIPAWCVLLAGIALCFLGVAIWRSLGWLFGLAVVLVLGFHLWRIVPALADAGLAWAERLISIYWFSDQGAFGIWAEVYSAHLALWILLGLLYNLPRVERLLQLVVFGPLTRLATGSAAVLAPPAVGGHLSIWLFAFFGLASLTHGLFSGPLTAGLASMGVIWSGLFLLTAHLASYAVFRRAWTADGRIALSLWSAFTVLALGVLHYFGSSVLGDGLSMWLILAAALIAGRKGGMVSVVKTMASLIVVYFAANVAYLTFAALFDLLRSLDLSLPDGLSFWWVSLVAGLLVIGLSLLHGRLDPTGRAERWLDIARCLAPVLLFFWLMTVEGFSPALSVFWVTPAAICLWLCVTLEGAADGGSAPARFLVDRLGDRLALAGCLLTLGTLGCALIGIISVIFAMGYV